MTAAKIRATVVKAFMELLSGHDWEAVTLAKIADASGIGLSQLREVFDGKVAIVEAFGREIDAKVLDRLDEDMAEELPRERLMDVLLSRFDALQPYKPAVRAIARAARADLSLAAQLNRAALVSMTWMLNAANVDTSGIGGAVRVQGAALVFAKVMRVWLNDDESMARTMAALDRELRAGERNMRRLRRVSSLMSPLRRLRTRCRARRVDGDPRRDDGESGEGREEAVL